MQWLTPKLRDTILLMVFGAVIVGFLIYDFPGMSTPIKGGIVLLGAYATPGIVNMLCSLISDLFNIKPPTKPV